MIDLGAWLLANGSRRHEHGAWDCCSFPAQWAIDNGLPDPMAHWRGAYSDSDGARALIRDAGSLTQLFRCGMEAAGISERRGDVRQGDIGVIRIGDEEAGAIFTGKRWALLANRGIVATSIEPELVAAAWCIDG